MSSIISGLNIKNIFEYDPLLAYDKFDIIDYQLITGISVYPSYTGLGNTGLCSWFNNDNLEDFKTDGNFNITGWKNKVINSGDLLQFSEDDNVRPNVQFNEPYITLKNLELLSGTGFEHTKRTIFLAVNSSEPNKPKTDNQKIIKFGHTLLAPFIPYHERCLFTKIFNEYYNTDNLDSLKLPQKPEIEYHSLNSTRQHKSDFMSTEYLYLNELPLEQKLKIFIKEYMEESYLPWLWLLCELVEKDNTSAFDIKVIQWANHLLEKINLTCENLYENRKKKICQPILNALIDIFKNNSYFVSKYLIMYI